jgi:hypothetical protein
MTGLDKLGYARYRSSDGRIITRIDLFSGCMNGSSSKLHQTFIGRSARCSKDFEQT